MISEGRLVLVTDIAEVAALELRNRFLFVKGEYFLDRRQGVPYFDVVFVKNPDVLLIRSLFRKVILSVQNILSIQSLVVTFDNAARKLFFSFQALAANGRIISGGSDLPFIVEP